MVLKDLSFSIKPGERIGVVGRTGSGKSTLLQVLFRMINATSGSIRIDEVDTSVLPLEKLRSKLSIIPQDPTLFNGSVRYNLDPLGIASDEDLWNALELSHLREVVENMDGQLDAIVAEHGENLSVGQRQLVCMARAILRHSKVIAMDEATASVDLETDQYIQTMIRTQFVGCTIVTIAHRLHTIMDRFVSSCLFIFTLSFIVVIYSDRILVMDNGNAVEFDSPERLLQNPEGIFSKLVAAANDETLYAEVRKADDDSSQS